MTDWDEKAEARKLHDTLGLIGLRAHATAVGFVQLCAELLKAGVIDDPAVSRIKDAIAKDIIVTRTIMPVRSVRRMRCNRTCMSNRTTSAERSLGAGVQDFFTEFGGTNAG
jgi:hypothetical protein